MPSQRSCGSDAPASNSHDAGSKVEQRSRKAHRQPDRFPIYLLPGVASKVTMTTHGDVVVERTTPVYHDALYGMKEITQRLLSPSNKTPRGVQHKKIMYKKKFSSLSVSLRSNLPRNRHQLLRSEENDRFQFFYFICF